MCQVCRHTHCLSVCPNAPDPPAVTTCARCGESVTPGYEYARIDGLDYCAECIEDMPYCELVPLLGGIIWKRGTTKGAAASAAVGMITALLSIFGVITVPFSSIFPVLPAIAAYIVVSLCTKHAPTENTARVAEVVEVSASEKSNNAAN